MGCREQAKPEALVGRVQTYMYLAATHLPACGWRRIDEALVVIEESRARQWHADGNRLPRWWRAIVMDEAGSY